MRFTEIVSQCPLCSNNKFSLFHQSEFYGYHIEYRLCKKCGLVFQSPRMTELESTVFYTQDYYLFQESRNNPISHIVKVQEKRSRALCDFTQDIIPSVSRHLDIGCSLGFLLRHFQVKYHSLAVGVEPNTRCRLQSYKNGLMVYSSLDELNQNEKERFDLVTMSHILEHLPNPVGYLSYLRENILTPDGRLLLEVPNLYGHDSFDVAHLFTFSPHTLREVLYQSGFTIIKFEKHGRPHSKILPVYLTVLCCPTLYPNFSSIHLESNVLFKRKFGMIWMHILVGLFAKGKWFVKNRLK